MRQYDLVFKFLPQLIHEYEIGSLKLEALYDFQFWKYILEKNGDNDIQFDWEELSVSKETFGDGKLLVIYTFPTPYGSIVKTKYGALFVDILKNKISYFTLENSGKKEWFLGSMNHNGTHSNLGRFLKDPTLENFTEEIKKWYCESSNKNPIRPILLLCSALLLLAIFPFPIGYYTFLRITVTIGAIIVIAAEFKKGINYWVLIFCLIAILFNPIAPVYLNKPIWILIDLVCGVIFGIKAINKKM